MPYLFFVFEPPGLNPTPIRDASFSDAKGVAYGVTRLETGDFRTWGWYAVGVGPNTPVAVSAPKHSSSTVNTGNVDPASYHFNIALEKVNEQPQPQPQPQPHPQPVAVPTHVVAYCDANDIRLAGSNWPFNARKPRPKASSASSPSVVFYGLDADDVAVAFADPTNVLWTYDGAAGFTNRDAALQQGTSPSVDVSRENLYCAAFQGQNGNLWTMDPELGITDRQLGMMGLTSPAIATLERHDHFYAVAFQANTGSLWTLDPDLGAVDRNASVMSGTSPSIVVSNGSMYAVAFQGSNGSLWTMDPKLGTIDRKVALAPGSSPSIARLLRSDHFYAVAARANDGGLVTMDPDKGVVQRPAKVMAGTSPSCAHAYRGKGFTVTFVDEQGCVSSLLDEKIINSGEKCTPGTSASIAVRTATFLG